MREGQSQGARILRVDLASMSWSTDALDEADMRRFIGGPSLAAAILTRELAPGIEPYSPDNLLVMAPGGLTATPVPGSDRLSLAARSPLTGFYW